MRTPLLVLAGAAVAALGAAQPAMARPAYAAKENVACVYCHVGQGGQRNFRGLYYAAHQLSFTGFDNAYEAKLAGVPADATGRNATPANTDYPKRTVPAALDFTVKDIDGKPVNLARYYGDVALVVNVASLCGNTPQYAALQKLYDTYRSRGLVVLGFPANDFGKQEPGSNSEIKEFCTSKYKVSFPMFSKVVVKGDEQTPFYKYLTNKETDPKYGGDIEWNFAKFLINRKGEIIARFAAKLPPSDPQVVQAIEKALAASKPADANPLPLPTTPGNPAAR